MSELPQAFNDLLSIEECAAIDQTLLSTRDRFSIRVTVYSWRYLQRVSVGLGVAIGDLQPQQIQDWILQDPQVSAEAVGDAMFSEWLGHLLLSSLKPLRAIAQQEGSEIERLTLEQIIGWFEDQVKTSGLSSHN